MLVHSIGTVQRPLCQQPDRAEVSLDPRHIGAARFLRQSVGVLSRQKNLFDTLLDISRVLRTIRLVHSSLVTRIESENRRKQTHGDTTRFRGHVPVTALHSVTPCRVMWDDLIIETQLRLACGAFCFR
jgi:hypothetical protein